MLAALLSVVLVTSLPSAVIAVEAEERTGVSTDESSAILKTLSEAIEARVKDAQVIVVDAGALGCPSDQRCSETIRARTNADQILFVRMIGIAATIRFIAEIETKDGIGLAASGDLARTPAARRSTIEKIVASLFAETRDAAPHPIVEATKIPPPVEPPKPERRDHTVSWILFGGGAAMVATGVAFGLENLSARHQGEMTYDPMRVDQLKMKALYTGLVADFAFGIAAVAVAIGALLFVLE
jgi:hypothetical protein